MALMAFVFLVVSLNSKLNLERSSLLECQRTGNFLTLLVP